MSKDYRSEEAKAYRLLYKRVSWKRLRDEHLRGEPLCVYCKKSGEITSADLVDHIKPHRGNIRLFLDPENLQSLCEPHHSGHKQREELGQKVIHFDANGWPI